MMRYFGELKLISTIFLLSLNCFSKQNKVPGNRVIGRLTCTPLSDIHGEICKELDKEDVALKVGGKARLCNLDKRGFRTKACFGLLKEDEWNVPAQNRYVDLLMNRTDFCDPNYLISCQKSYFLNGSFEFVCMCDLDVGDRLRKNETFPCVAKPGTACAFKKPLGIRKDPNSFELELNAHGYKCKKNTECIGLNGEGNATLLESMNNTFGYFTPTNSLPTPYWLFIYRSIANVCACIKDYTHNARGDCVNIYNPSSTPVQLPYTHFINLIIILLSLLIHFQLLHFNLIQWFHNLT